MFTHSVDFSESCCLAITVLTLLFSPLGRCPITLYHRSRMVALIIVPQLPIKYLCAISGVDSSVEVSQLLSCDPSCNYNLNMLATNMQHLAFPFSVLYIT